MGGGGAKGGGEGGVGREKTGWYPELNWQPNPRMCNNDLSRTSL